MTVSEVLKQTWAAVAAEGEKGEGYYRRRLPLTCRWPIHAGVHYPKDQRFIILETELEPSLVLTLRDTTKGYTISVDFGLTGRNDLATIQIQETDVVYGEIFTVFCADILQHWILRAGDATCFESLRRRLGRWKKFFERGPSIGLSREDHVGLYGELTFIEAGLSVGLSAVSIANAWQAPLATNQDFLFGSLAAEIKTVTANDMHSVRIANARQLDSVGLEALFLIRYLFDFRRGSGRTLLQLLHTLEEKLASSPEALSVLKDRLLDYGFIDGTANEFDEWGFTSRGLDIFRVTEGFPRLIEGNMPWGVSEISYTLNLSAAQSFQIAQDDFWNRIKSSHG